MAFSIANILGGSIADVVKGVVGTFKLDPAVKAQMDTAIEEHKFELAQLDAQYNAKLLDFQATEVTSASGNIQAEEKSGDKYTSRARPTFLYIMELILVWNYLVVPLWGSHQPIALPTPLFWLFGSCMLGYTGARTWEKLQGVAG